MAKVSTEYKSLLQRDVSPSPARLSDFTPPEKKIAKKEEPKVANRFDEDRFIGPEDSEEQVRLDYKSLIG